MKLTTTLDLTKYKRFFAFGCSFTIYQWDTWADIIGHHVPEYYNYGIAGSGNHCIFNSIAEANARHKFTNDDLVIVMWSGVTREDRYIKNAWLHCGNIYNQNVYDDNFVRRFTCPRGYLIRDLAYMSTIKNILQNSSSDWDFLSMNDISGGGSENKFGDKTDISGLSPDTTDVMDLYKTTINSIRLSCQDFVASKYPHGTGDDSSYIFSHPNKIVDCHPTPKMYYEYLCEIYPHHNLSSEVRDSVLSSTIKLIKEGCHTGPEVPLHYKGRL